MNYKKIYDQLVEKCKVRGLDKSALEGYFEKHHILPRCMGGSDEDENLVLLTGREHFVAHMLLWKAFPESKSLAFAAMMMSNRALCKVNSTTYERLRSEFCLALSEKFTGKRVRDLMGMRFTRLTVLEQADFYYSPRGSKQALWICECDCGNILSVVGGSLTSKNTQSCGCLTIERCQSLTGENNPFFGKKHTEETKEKFKLRPVRYGEDHHCFGVEWTEARKAALSAAKKGIPWTQAQRESITASLRYGEDHHMFGKKHSEESLLKMSESQKARNVRPWDNQSTQTEESMLKWTMCDYYHDLWVHFDRPGLKKFTKIYNELHNDNVSLAFFTNPRLNWLKGWVPNEDSQWLEFRDSYMGVECQ